MKREYELIIYLDKAHEYRWRFAAPNRKFIADSGEGYTTRSGAIRAARRLRVIAADAVLVKG
jgi:uncharacterized protein YegP (UPF0339 family)